jgi:hypothetical protein
MTGSPAEPGNLGASGPTPQNAKGVPMVGFFPVANPISHSSRSAVTLNLTQLYAKPRLCRVERGFLKLVFTCRIC